MTSIPADAGAIRVVAAKFRICPATGLKVDLAAERLIKANAVAAVIFLAVGGLFGLLVALTRWPAVHLLPFDWFYLILTAHGLDVLLSWRLAAPRWGWVGFALMIIGGLIVNVAVLQGDSSVMMTSYPPLQGKP